MKKKPEIYNEYDKVIKEQLKSGVIEEVEQNEETPKPPGSIHFLPHREIIREDRQTTKIRIVYDASSKMPGQVSLNDCLHPGPNLAPLIFDILLRFQMNKVAMIGDIEKAFLNISIDPAQRDLLRFLWVKNKDAPNPEVISLRFARLVFGLTCSPYILNAVIRKHVESMAKSDKNFVEITNKSLYVDDIACSLNSESDCFTLYQKLKTSFQAGGFNLRKWASNSSSLIESIEKAENATDQKLESSISLNAETHDKQTSHAVCKDEEIKVLGIPWNTKTDKMKLSFSNFSTSAKQEHITKRIILSTTAQFFDPLGLLSPVILPLKHIFQELCKLKINWDDNSLPEELSNRYCNIIADMVEVDNIEINRSLLNGIELKDGNSIQIHGFADASKIAYGACIYLRINTNNGVYIRLVTAKTRIAPLKQETIPRLELMAALTLAQLITSVKNALQSCIEIEATYCWSDSQVVLFWIHGDSKVHKQFVQNGYQKFASL